MMQWRLPSTNPYFRPMSYAYAWLRLDGRFREDETFREYIQRLRWPKKWASVGSPKSPYFQMMRQA
jgi:hypothetical protein